MLLLTPLSKLLKCETASKISFYKNYNDGSTDV